MPDAPSKAYLSLIPANSAGGAELGRVTFPYNPKELSYTKTADWERKSAKGAKTAATPEFKGAKPTTLTVEVFLDGYEAGEDVSGDIQTLCSCCQPLSDSISSKKPSPPWVVLGWGAQTILTAIVKSVAVKCTMFGLDGTPLRATCTVSLEEVTPDAAPQNPTSGGLSTLRSHLMIEGDTLPSVAYRHYGQAGWWRPLAEVNGIDDPLRVPAGTRVLVPDIDENFGRIR
jgi:nucleoid-associated protein YgaU